MRPSALIVEDDAVTREALRHLMELDGLATDIATDGEKGLGLLMQRVYDVVLLDIALPKISGADIMENLTATHPEVLEKIIVVTGLDAAEIRRVFPTVCSVLSKPVIPSRLRELVRRCVPEQRNRPRHTGVA